MTTETFDVQSVLGVDLEDLAWQDLAICSSMPTNDFYDNYESNERVARTIDQVCLSCPVMAQCLERGMDNNEWGVWGGIWLTSGKPDTNRNKHKTQEVWDLIRERISDSVL